MPDNHSVTAENFTRLLSWLDTDVECAGEEYERIRQGLVRMFIGRGCYEAEILADRTIDRVTSKISQIGETFVGEPANYFYGVANMVHHEWLREQKRERELTFIDLTAEPPDETEFSCLETCLGKLPPDLRAMILEYYRDDKRAKIESRKRLAERLGVSIGALQIRTSRIRSRLAACVKDCLGRKPR
jgi:DNA-directed RNA polymerase specialized sigma24 family protein